MVVVSLAAPRLLASSPDEMFVLDVAKDGMAEVELGRLASEKATSDDVKKFAQRMATGVPTRVTSRESVVESQ
jgi:predicted outer membrane protein